VLVRVLLLAYWEPLDSSEIHVLWIVEGKMKWEVTADWFAKLETGSSDLKYLSTRLAADVQVFSDNGVDGIMGVDG